MTEDEAKTKWCPFARIDGANGAYNAEYNGGYLKPASFCIGSACAAWRGAEQYEVISASPSDPTRKPFHVSGVEIDAYRSAAWRITDLGPSGFCGLAGQP